MSENPLEHYIKRFDEQFLVSLRNNVIVVVAVHDRPDVIVFRNLFVASPIKPRSYTFAGFVAL